mmetsp:Transcript_6986/g.22056  ORF Transcript_6986/g.22056 Transcript_6986/m.22056 type:complete len:409 (+) Transcript_6986:408-1634(+)
MLYLLEAIGIDRETLRGAAALASTAEGQSATAVLVVLVFWAVVTGRVYVVSRPAPPKPRLGMAALSTRSASEDGRPPLSPRPLSRRRTTSRKGSGLDDVDAGDAPPDEREIADGPLKPEDLAAAAGPAVRDPATHRLLLRDGAYWCGSPDAGAFKVRGENYLMDRVKVPVGDSVFKLLDCDLFDVDQPENHMARHLESRMAALWAESGLLVPSKRPFTWVIQLQVPGPPYKSFCMYYGCPDRDVIFKAETPFARVARRFFQPVTSPTGCGVNSDGGGEFGATSNDLLHGWRNNTFKLIPRCVNAPFLVKRAVGEVPTLLGNKIQLLYYGPAHGDYFETDCNIASSKIAQYTIGLAIDRASVVIADMAFVLQGAAPAELPETLCGAVRIEHIVMKDSHKLDLSSSKIAA